VLALPDRPAELLNIPADLPVGVKLDRPRHVTSLQLPPGALLCCYTDGLVERRDAALDDGLHRLLGVVRPEPAEQVCIRVMGAMVGSDVPTDDIAVLVTRRLEVSPG
jgi:serine phosphatase RsbU (regulator of sigma subunit)